MSMCSNMFCVADLYIYSHTKKDYQDDTTAIEVSLTLIRFSMTYKTQRVFSDGIRGRILHMQTSTRLLLPRWNVVIDTVSPKTIYQRSN